MYQNDFNSIYNQINQSKENVYQFSTKTPLIPFNDYSSNITPYLKLENLQPIGSFKVR